MTSTASSETGITTDPFLLEIVRNHLITTCKEMGIAMMRTSYSPMFNEALDFSCVVFDANAEMVAQAPFVPAQIGVPTTTTSQSAASMVASSSRSWSSPYPMAGSTGPISG